MTSLEDWSSRIDGFAALAAGWDSYTADPPSAWAVSSARRFLTGCELEARSLYRVNPSVVGGVGVTFKNGARFAYLKFRNTGTVHVAFYPVVGVVCEVTRVEDTEQGFARAVAAIGKWLGPTAAGEE